MDFNHKWYQQLFILLIAHYSIKLEAATTGLSSEGRQCVCAGDRLFYNCSVVGGTATRWKGSLLIDCPLDVITLRHSQFESNEALETCNNGDIVGRGIGVVDNHYASQLSVTVRENFNNKTVQCILNSNEGMRIIGESLLSVLSATNLHPPPDNLYLADVQPGKLIFNWSSNNCNNLQYNITSDCGICPIVTNMTTATCSGLQLTPNAVTCHFRVSSHTCNLPGNPSSPIEVILKVPNVPQVELVPSYSNNSQVLEKLFIFTTMNQTEDIFYISGGITGSPTSYTARTLNLVSGASFNSTVGLSSCEEGNGCPVELPRCSQSTVINISISAANRLGEGPHSNPFMIECTNNFVQVVYRGSSSEPTISCVFLNQSDTSEKTCCITYQLCDLIEPQKVQKCNKNSPYNVRLQLSGRSSETHCYIVTASNDTYTVKVEGTFTLDDNHREGVSTTVVAAGVIVPLISLAVLLLGTGIIVWVVIRAKKKPHKYSDSNSLPDIPPPNLKPLDYLIPYHLPATLEYHYVPMGTSDFELREFITEVLCDEFRRGHTFYEFTNGIENILEGKEVLLQDRRNSKKWFRLDQSKALGLKLYGEGIARRSFGKQYRVFIQSFGPGTRHLPGGSSVYYNNSDDQVEPDVLQLVPICSEHFSHAVIEEECEVKQFCTQHRLNPNAFNLFLTVEHLPEGMRHRPPRDVILKNRESKQLYTGPFARQILDQNDGDKPDEWTVFVLLEKNKQGLVLKKGSEVLYQDSMYLTGTFTVMDVDQNHVRMSKFIETKLNCKFEDGKAFYEATENEEDLLYYKKILRPQTNELGCKELKLESLVEYFYAIPGVPAKAVKPDELNAGLKHCKIFIQSTSQGSRCLKAGTKLLYLKEYIKLNPIDSQTDDHPDDSEVDCTTGSS